MGDVAIGIALWIAGSVASAVVLLATGIVDATSGSSVATLSLAAIVIGTLGGWIGLAGWPVVATMWKGQRSLVKDFGLGIRPIDLLWGLLGGFAALVVAAVGSMLWRVSTGESAPSNSEYLPTHPGVGTVIGLFVFIAVLTPIVEELFFRGLFLRSVGRRWNLVVGVVLSSAVFGLLHWQGGSIGHSLFIAAVTAGYGAVFALLVINADGRLGPSIVAHMIVNLVGVAAAVLL